MKKIIISLLCVFMCQSAMIPLMADEDSVQKNEDSVQVSNDSNQTSEDSEQSNEETITETTGDGTSTQTEDASLNNDSNEEEVTQEEKPSTNENLESRDESLSSAEPIEQTNTDSRQQSTEEIPVKNQQEEQISDDKMNDEEEQGATGGDESQISESQNYTEIKMYRIYNPNSGEHFYTGSYEEFDHLWNLGWVDEGIGWIAPSYSDYPVYRLYNPNAGEHFFTLSTDERDNLKRLGWNDEGIGWYSADKSWNGVSPLYRQYNPNAFANNHNYTLSLGENNWLAGIGWRAEGVSWYAVSNYSAPGTRVHEIPDEPTYYSQRDPRWSGATYNGYSLYSTGCVPTSVAMVVDGYLHNGVTPNIAADYLVTTGEFAGRKHGGSGLAIKLGAEHWGLGTEGINTESGLVNCLSSGYMVVFQVGGGTFTSRGSTHAIVLYGNSNGATRVYDPWNARNGWYSISMIWNQRSTSSYDWTGGYVGYGIFEK